MKYMTSLLLLLFLTVGCAQKEAMHMNDLKESDLENAVLVDVRTPEEFAQGHLDNALNINLLDPSFDAQFAELDKDRTVYVYCKVGGRSAKAQQRLKAKGFKHVVNLEGGYDAYKQRKGRQ